MSKRRRPFSGTAEKIIKAQGWLCFWCENHFLEWVWHNGKLEPLGVHFDHVIPYSFLEANPTKNFVAACHICNLIKGKKLFHSVEECREHIKNAWDRRGIRIHTLGRAND